MPGLLRGDSPFTPWLLIVIERQVCLVETIPLCQGCYVETVRLLALSQACYMETVPLRQGYRVGVTPGLLSRDSHSGLTF